MLRCSGHAGLRRILCLGFVGLLSSVGHAVTTENASLAKGFITEVTAVGLLSSVDPAMSSEIVCMAKGFTTVVTVVGLLSSVDPAVNC